LFFIPEASSYLINFRDAHSRWWYESSHQLPGHPCWPTWTVNVLQTCDNFQIKPKNPITLKPISSHFMSCCLFSLLSGGVALWSLC
jgi:hypothetical protein